MRLIKSSQLKHAIMKLKINTQALIAAVSTARNALDSRSPYEAWKSIRVSASDDITVSALSQDMRCDISVDGEILAQGSALIPGRYIQTFLSSFDGEFTEVESIAGKVILKSGNTSFAMPEYANKDEFPSRDNVTCTPSTVIANPQSFIQALRVVIKSSHPKCVCIDSGGFLFSTDNRRIAIAQFEVITTEQFQFAISRDACQAILDSAGDSDASIGICFGDKIVRFISERAVIRCKPAEMRRIDPYKAFPEVEWTKIMVGRQDVLGALQRSRLCNPVSCLLKIADGEIKVVSDMANTERNDNEAFNESVAVNYHGEPMEIKINPDHLVGALEALGSDDVTLEFAGPRAPIKVSVDTYDGFVYGFMPMRNDSNV